jgi:dienelactone hydrolase
MSMGGYLAPRAAAFDHRIAACVAYDGVFNFASALPPATTIDEVLAHPAQVPTGLRWAVLNGRWTFAVATVQELIEQMAKYDLAPVVDQIACPTLVCDAENDQFFKGQPQALYDALSCPKTLLKFTAAEGAEEHCHEGALTLFHQRMFDWLDDTLAS